MIVGKELRMLYLKGYCGVKHAKTGKYTKTKSYHLREIVQCMYAKLAEILEKEKVLV